MGPVGELTVSTVKLAGPVLLLVEVAVDVQLQRTDGEDVRYPPDDKMVPLTVELLVGETMLIWPPL